MFQRTANVVFMFLVVCFVLCFNAQADLSISYDYSLATSSSRAFILGSDDNAITSFDWAAALPAGYSTDGNKIYVPLKLLGHLRDGADQSQHYEASQAAAWIRDLMGLYSNTETSSLSTSLLVEIDTGSETSEWCGNGLDADKRCVGLCTSPEGPTVCTGCNCRGKKTFKEEAP